MFVKYNLLYCQKYFWNPALLGSWSETGDNSKLCKNNWNHWGITFKDIKIRILFFSSSTSFPKMNFSGCSSGLTSSSYSLCALSHLFWVTTWYKIDKEQQRIWWLECDAVIKGNLGFSVYLYFLSSIVFSVMYW